MNAKEEVDLADLNLESDIIEDENNSEFYPDPIKCDVIIDGLKLKRLLQVYGSLDVLKMYIQDSRDFFHYVKEIPELINLAANSCDPRILSYLLKFDDDIEVDLIYNHLTAINSLAINITTENFHDVFKCIKQLINYGADPNIPDQVVMAPILSIMLNNELDDEKKKTIIKYLVNLEYPKVNIDFYVWNRANVRTLLRSNFPDIQLPSGDTNKSPFLILPKLLREKRENYFLQWLKKDKIKIPDNINQKKNFILCLLKIAIKNNLIRAVEVLLERRFFNVLKASYIGIKTACNVGNSQILKMLLGEYNINPKVSWDLLIKLMPMMNKTNENFDYIECFDIILDSSKVEPIGRSRALHYAIQSNNEEATVKLFRKGANLHRISLDYINPGVLEKCFDTCITTNGLEHDKRAFRIHISYKNFQHINPDENLEIYSQGRKCWPRYFCKGHEMWTIRSIAESKHLKHLLSHPLISSLLFLKWHELSAFFYMNLVVCFCFYICLISCIFLDLSNANEASQITLKILSSLGLIYIFLREAIQCITLRRLMFTTAFAFIPNCIEIALIVSTALTLSHSNYQIEPQRTYAVLTILLVSVETNTENSNIKEDTDTDAGHFDSVFGSIFKTFIMVTGEFESGSIKFNSPTSYVIFIIFVAFMSIILLNLLNGLAVSDTQMIRMQAELNKNICLTYLIVNFERTLTTFKNIPLCSSIFNSLTASVLDYIQGDGIDILTRRGNIILIKNRDEWYDGEHLRSPISTFPCSRYSIFRLKNCVMDLTTVRAAYSVLEKKQRIQEQEKIILVQRNRLKNIEKKVEEQEIRLRNIEKNCEMMLPLVQKLAENVK